MCFDAEKGDELWRKNVASEYGGKQMGVWGFSSSPILDGDLLLLPIGGQDGTVVAFRKDGQLAWRTTEIKDEAPYGCVVPVTIFGQKQYLLYTMSGLWAINPENGKVLWHGEKIAKDAISNDPIIWEDKSPGTAAAFGMIMMDNGEGSTGFRVTENAGESGGFVVETSFVDKQLNNHNCGLVLHEGSVYVTTNRGLHCLDIKTGKMAWQHRCVGKGALTFVDGFLIVRSEKGDGTIVLVEATPEEYREKGRFDQPDRSDKNSWTYPVIVDGKLYIRDQNVLLCYDLLCYD